MNNERPPKTQEELQSEFNRLSDLILELPNVLIRNGKKEAGVSTQFIAQETIYFKIMKEVDKNQLSLNIAIRELQQVLDTMKKLALSAGVPRAALADNQIKPYEH